MTTPEAWNFDPEFSEYHAVLMENISPDEKSDAFEDLIKKENEEHPAAKIKFLDVSDLDDIEKGKVLSKFLEEASSNERYRLIIRDGEHHMAVDVDPRENTVGRDGKPTKSALVLDSASATEPRCLTLVRLYENARGREVM